MTHIYSSGAHTSARSRRRQSKQALVLLRWVYSNVHNAFLLSALFGWDLNASMLLRTLGTYFGKKASFDSRLVAGDNYTKYIFTICCLE